MSPVRPPFPETSAALSPTSVAAEDEAAVATEAADELLPGGIRPSDIPVPLDAADGTRPTDLPVTSPSLCSKSDSKALQLVAGYYDSDADDASGAGASGAAAAAAAGADSKQRQHEPQKRDRDRKRSRSRSRRGRTASGERRRRKRSRSNRAPTPTPEVGPKQRRRSGGN